MERENDEVSASNMSNDYNFLDWLWINIHRFVDDETVKQMQIAYATEVQTEPKQWNLSVNDREELFLKDALLALIDYVTHEIIELPTNVIQLRECMTKYYLSSLGALSDDLEERKRARLNRWDHKLVNAFVWFHSLENDQVNTYGTTNLPLILKLRKEYTYLSAVIPSRVYKVVEIEGSYSYDGVIDLDTDEWNEVFINELITDGYVIGPFVYSSEKEAEYAQSMRV